MEVTTDPPPGLIPIPLKGAVLLLTAAEFTAIAPADAGAAPLICFL